MGNRSDDVRSSARSRVQSANRRLNDVDELASFLGKSIQKLLVAIFAILFRLPFAALIFLCFKALGIVDVKSFLGGMGDFYRLLLIAIAWGAATWMVRRIKRLGGLLVLCSSTALVTVLDIFFLWLNSK